MAIYGADIEALEGLATRFETHKDTIVGLIHQVGGELDGIVWEGPDAETLRPEWVDRLNRLVGVIDEAFASIGLEATQQAAEQREASGV